MHPHQKARNSYKLHLAMRHVLYRMRLLCLLLGPKPCKNCDESHERGKPTAIFSKRRKIDPL